LPLFDLTQSALLLEPNAPSLYNVDGSLNWLPNASGTSTFTSNPMIFIFSKYWNKTYNLISNAVLSYKILPGLELKSSIGFNKMQTDDYRSLPLTAVQPERRSLPGYLRMADYGNRNINSWIIEPQISYKSKVSNGKLEVLLGATLLNLKTNVSSLRGTGHLSDELLENINAAANISSLYASKADYKYNAGFGRINYNWLDKYIINLTGRRDGSSRFGNENQFHNFVSIGGAWLFSNDRFIKNTLSFLSFGKLRGSYGITGNDQIGDYSFLSLYSYPAIQVPYQGVVSIMPASLPNPHLKWEETRKLQVGLDLGFFQERILLNVNFARNRSSNQLLSYEVPSVAGFTSYLLNFPATIQNRNWEFFISTKNISRKDISWTSSINLTLPKNKLLSFPNLASSSYSNSLVVGQPLTIQRLLHFIGVDPTTGNYMFQSKTDPFRPTYPDDYTTLQNIDPKFYGGFQNTLNYKQFELDFLFQFVKQTSYNDAIFWNGNRIPGSFFEGLSNQPVSVLDRWQKPGDNSTISKFSSVNNFLAPIVSSDYRFTDASYIRLKNVALSWELPNKWIHKAYLKKCRIYIHGQNLITITKYKGLDPESKNILTPALPPLRVIMAGVHLGF
jgi:TonB-dependent starch-binding outer membrane protein SusC